jgi:asparagine synthase (glutamine-hydrolysing)
MDGRVLAFSATRPREERCSGGQTKLLLRAAMRGLVPDDVLAEREMRTGVPGGYFSRALREAHATLMIPIFRDSRLASLGIVDQDALLQACELSVLAGDEELGLRLVLTLHAELWLRGHELSQSQSASMSDLAAAPPLSTAS